MNALVVWVAFLALVVITLRYLPFINLELALRFQFWIRNLGRQLQSMIDRMEAEAKQEERKQKKDKQ